MHTINSIYELFLKAGSITTDTRNCAQGSIFFALKGESFNGNKFAKQAIEAGCSYAIVDEKEFAISHQYVLVDKVLQTLQKLANHHRKQFNIPVIGITGTNGKTTTKELISATLGKKFNTLFTQGNFNNHIGVPLTLLNLNPQHDIAVIEMGANHQGEIGFLAKIAEPDYGIITNIGMAHLEGFGSYENVIETKNELYNFIRETNGKLFYNETNELLCKLSQNTDRIAYGSMNNAIKTSILETSPTLTIKLKTETFETVVNTNLRGAYNLENIQAAICIGNYFNVDMEDIAEAIKHYEPTNNRSQLSQTDKNTLILDMYNANPTSMALAISDFQNSTFEHKIAILGDMKELGDYTDKEHKKILNILSECNFERVLCIGEAFLKNEHNFPEVDFYKTTNDALKKLQREQISGATILIKGSRSIKLENLLGTL